jgi:hypothetical protein
MNLSETSLRKKLKDNPLEKVLLFTIDDGGNEYLVKSENVQSKER